MADNALDQVIQVRRSIGDPVTSDFVIVEGDLPAEPLKNTAYTKGNGVYWFHDGVDWREYTLKFGDAYIGALIDHHGLIKAAVRLIDNLIARIDPSDYITSGNAGGQSMSFPSLQDVLAYYNALRDRLLEEEAEAAGMNSGLMLKTKKKMVGGVQEEDE